MKNTAFQVSVKQLWARVGTLESARKRVLCDGLKTILNQEDETLYPDLTLH